MNPGYKFLFLLVSLFVILELTHCADEEGKHEIVKVPVPPKNRYIVEKTQNVTEKREAVPRTLDDGFQESFRKVRKVHKKLVNKKLSQYDETEDLERKRIKDSDEGPKKNIEEVQHVIQKMKIVENPSFPAEKQNTDELKATLTNTSEQKQKTADDSETKKKVSCSDTITQDESKAEEDKEKVVHALPSTEMKRKSIIDSEIERQEESEKVDSLNTNHQKKIITSPGRKGKKVIRTIYVTEGKGDAGEEQDNLEDEYTKLKETDIRKASLEKEAGAKTKKRTDLIETEEKTDENTETLPKQKKFTEVEEIAEPDEIKPASDSEPRITVRRIIVRRPIKIIRKNISRSAKEEEQKENRSEEQTFVDSEIRTVPIRRKKKIRTTSETEKDQSKDTVEGTEDSETVIEKPEGQESVKHITIKRTRSGKDTKRSDKTNTEDVEIITDSEEPSFESKTVKLSKPKRITRRIITETKENEPDYENEAQKNNKKTVNVIDNTDLDSDKNILKKNVNEKEVDISVDTEKEKEIADGYAQEEKIEVHTEKTIYTAESQPLLEKEIDEKCVPKKTKKILRIVKVNEGEIGDKKYVKPRKIRVIKKRTEDKHRGVNKSKSIAEIEEEIRLMLSQGRQTEKPKCSKKEKSSKGKKKPVTITNKLKRESEIHEHNLKPIDIYTDIVESTEEELPGLKEQNKGITPKIQQDVFKTKKFEKVEITTTLPLVVIKDKGLTEIKAAQEDANIHETHLEKLKEPEVDSMEPGTWDLKPAYTHKSQNAVLTKIVKSEAFKGDTKITETDDKEKIPKLKEKKLMKSDIQKGSIQITETGIDKKTSDVQDIIEPHSKTVKKIAIIAPETHKKETEIEVNKQLVETEEANVMKTPRKVVKKAIVGTEIRKDADVVRAIRSKIRPLDEIETPTSIIVKKTIAGSDTQKNREVSEIEHETKKLSDETEVIDKTGKRPGCRPKIIKIITTTVSETQSEHDGTKLKSQDKRVKPAMESGPTITVKKINKIGSETYEDIAVPKIHTKNDKVEPIKDAGKLNTVVEKKIRKTDSETLKEDAVAESEFAELKPIRKIEQIPVKKEKVKKIETEKKDIEVDTKTIKEFGALPESSTVIEKDAKKVDLHTEKRDIEIDSKTNEPVKCPKSRTLIVKPVKKVYSETENQDTEVDTITKEVIPTKKAGKLSDSRIVIVRKVNKNDSETQKDDFEDDNERLEIKTNKDNVKCPKSRKAVVRKVKKTDTETQKDEDLEIDTKSREVKTTKDIRKTPESNTAIVKKEKKIDSETQIDDNKTQEVKITEEIGKSPKSKTVIVKTLRKNESEREKDDFGVPEFDTKSKAPCSGAKFSKDIDKNSEIDTVINKKIRNIDMEKDDTNVDTKTNKAVVVKKVKITDSEFQKEADVPIVDTAKLQPSKLKPFRDIDSAPKIRNIIVKTVRKTDSETEKEAADAVKKHTVNVNPDGILEKLPESSAITRKRTIIESETPTEDTEVSDHDRKLKKETSHTEVIETNKVMQPVTYKDRMKDSQVENIKEKQYIISEQADKSRNLPAKAKTTQETVVSSKIVDSALEKEDCRKKTEDTQCTNQLKGDSALTISHTKTSSEIEDEKNVRKDKRFGDVTRITQTITSESEKDNVNAEKKQLIVPEDKGRKYETIVIKNKNVLVPEKVSMTSEQVKASAKTQEDKEQLVEKDETVTDTQVIEEEVDDDSPCSQNVEAASKQDSKSISKVVKSGAQTIQHVKTGTAGKVTTGRKTIIPKYSRRTLRGSKMKGRQATEFLFMLENDAEPTGLKDPSVADELMHKLKVSKKQNYTTYHVKRGKEWCTVDDLSALLLRLQVSMAKIRSVKEISAPYLQTLQELQKLSSKYIQDGYQASTGKQVKLQIKQFEKIQNTYSIVEIGLKCEANILTELAVKAICEIRSGMFKMECFKEKYPIFEKFLIPAEPDKKDCYGNVRKLSEWLKNAPELWKNKERRLNKLQASLENLKKSKEELKPGQNIKKSIAGVLCDIFNYLDVQAKFLNFSTKLQATAKLARREINICNKKEPIDPALADADK